MTKRERAQLTNLIAELDAEFQSAQALKEIDEEEKGNEGTVQYWDGVQSGLAIALNRLHNTFDEGR